MMNDRALRVLEFNKIQARLAEFALTGLGRERCMALRPQETLLQAQEALEETEEAQVILTYLGGSPLVEFSDVRPFLTMAEKGASLSPRSLIDIARSLTAARSARSALVTERENTPRITGLASHLQTLRWPISAATSARPTSACARSSTAWCTAAGSANICRRASSPCATAGM